MKNELIDYDVVKFKKFGGEVIEDVTEYIKDYIKRSNNIRIIVGCDSQQKRRITLYAITIVLYDKEIHKGAHVLFLRQKTKKNKDLISLGERKINFIITLLITFGATYTGIMLTRYISDTTTLNFPLNLLPLEHIFSIMAIATVLLAIYLANISDDLFK